jgi:hypothetical protein
LGALYNIARLVTEPRDCKNYLRVNSETDTNP